MAVATLIKSNRYIELKLYDKPLNTIKSKAHPKVKSRRYTSTNYAVNQKISISRAKKRLRRLLESNFSERYTFTTLTFRDDIYDMDIAWKCFSNFKKAIARYLQKEALPKLKYICVTEFQDQNRDGVIHFHMVSNLKIDPKDIVKAKWKYGYVKSQCVESNRISNQKICSYLTKHIDDQRLQNRRYFRCSKNLLKPLNLHYDNLEDLYSVIDSLGATIKNSREYYSAYTGKSKYEEYYLEDKGDNINA